MDRRCAAGALLALAACIATTAAAPTASNQTALDLYEGASEGCYYNFQHYGEGDRIMTNEPCLNCTCHNRMLMCYLRVCPFTKPIGQDCSVEKRADQCCPIVTCPDVPVDLLTSTSTSSPSEYGETGLGKLDRYGCSINGKYFPEGSKVPPSPNKPCEHCYCIRNMTTCVMQECTLHIDGCTPIYRKDVCCPVRYSCDHPEDETPLLDDMTTTVRPTPGFLLTTTTILPVTQMTQDCVHDDKIFADGALIKTEKACEHCYCMKGDIVCVVQECGTPMENEGKNCTSMPPREGQCCPDTYICEGDELTTETKPDTATVTSFQDITTLSPPRRVSVEGSGYRSETDEPSTELPIFEPDSEGSGEYQTPFKPTDTSDMLIPETETSPPFVSTAQDDIADKYSPSSTEIPELDKKLAEKATTEADKGENTVPSGDTDENTSEAYVQDKTSTEPETTTIKLEAATESSVDAKTTILPEDENSVKDKTTSHEEITVTEPASIAQSSIADHELDSSPGTRTTSESEHAETTLPTRRKEDDEETPIEITTLQHSEESTTKVSGLISPDTAITESTTSSLIEHETETSTLKIPEKGNDVTEPTTEAKLEFTTKSDVIKTDTQSGTTLQPEIATELSTPDKVDFTGTTSANPIENEIDEESFPTLAPGRIPGEGDCLLDGVTYSHESVVPSSSNCHTSCRCISSIVKCEPIICSPPPDYMDNCQPMYDSPESCCPAYVCDHPKETVPPQSHSQMAGTESPIPTPTIECNGDQCEVVKDKEVTETSVSCTSEGCTDDSSKKHVDTMDCGPQGCGEVQSKPEELRPLQHPEECAGESCSSPPVDCASGNCETTIPKEHVDTTDCGPQGCGEVQTKPEEARPLQPTEGCAGESCTSPPVDCASGNCETTIPKEHVDTTDCGPQGCGEVQTKPEEPHPLQPTEECAGDRCSPPAVDCASGSCETSIPKEHVDTTDCGPQGCGEVQTKPEEPHPLQPTEECAGDRCSPPAVDCASGSCETTIPKEHVDTTDCGPQGCGEVQTKPEEPRPLQPTEDCAGDSCSSPPMHCVSGDCETPIPKDQTCDKDNGCKVPDIQICQGDNCAIQPDVTAPKNDSTPCDNPESCKNFQIPDKAADCESETCTSELPPRTIPQEKQDCKDGDSCAQQTPAVEECNEEDCKRKQVPEITKPSSSDCTGTECIQQQGNVPQITDVPEVYTESVPTITGLPEAPETKPGKPETKPEEPETKLEEPEIKPEEPETKPEEPITDLPKTTAIQTEIEPSATTKASVTDKEEELGTTPQYDESDINKEKVPEPLVPESPEIVTPEGPQHEMVTEKETTMVPLQDITKVKEIIPDVTPALSEASTTEIPSLPDKDTKEKTTELPSFIETKPPEFMTSTDIDHVTSVTQDAAKDNNALDIATTEPSLPAVHSTSSDINQETTKSQEMLTVAQESLDSASHEETTKEPEYVQDTESKVTEPTERYTSAPDQVTDKLDVEPIEGQEPPAAPTTPKSYESQTNVPGALETEEPMKEVLHSSTVVFDTQTTSPQEQDRKESEMPVPTLPSEEYITDKPVKTMDITGDMSTPDNKAETKSPVVDEDTARPDMAPEESETQSPELNVTPGEESFTKAPVDATENENEPSKPLVTSPQETATEGSGTMEKDIEPPAPVTVIVQTETPMSIVKDHDDDEISSTITPESRITTVSDGLITKEPQSPASEQSTELIVKLTETPFEKMSSVSDVTTEKSEADLKPTISVVTDNVLATKQPVHDSEITTIPETEVSTESAPVTVPIIIETISSEPFVTEASIEESSTPQEETSESAPITSIPEDIETKLSVPVTESSEQPISEGVEIITPAQEQLNETTELPELVIHEHPTEPSSIVKETEQPATENIGTSLPDMAVKEQEIEPEKDTSDSPSPKDDVTVVPEIPTSESQKEVTVTSEQEPVTKMPEFPQSETTESKPDDLSHITELPATEPQKEVTEGPDSHAITTNAPEIAVTDAQKEATEAPAIQTVVTDGTMISGTQPQETVTEGVAQYTETDADVLVTQPHKYITDAPVSYDMISSTPDMDTEPHKEFTNKPEESEIEPHKETTGIHDITTAIPEISPTDSYKEPTEAPVSHDTVTKVSDISPTESDKEGVEELEPQNVVTSVPKISATELQEETTTVPDMSTNIPETEPKKDITETSVAQEQTTSIPAITVTENIPLEDTVSPMAQNKVTTVPEIYVTEPQKEGTDSPTHDDTSTKVPDEPANESQIEVTKGPAAQDAVTNAPDTSVTDSDENTQSPEPEDTATSGPTLPETEPKKESTETSAPEGGYTIPEISETEPKKEVTEMPEIQAVTDATEISDDSKAPATTITESQGEVTNIPEAQDAGTNAPEVQTESQKEVTEIQETSEKTATEAQNVPTEPPEIPATFDKDVTEASEQATGEVTKTPELVQTEAAGNEAATEKPAVTEKELTFTETPLKISTKFDDHTQSKPQEFVTSTESLNTESYTSLPTESGLPVVQFTIVTESLVTESPDKTTVSDSDIDKSSTGMAADEKKPQEEQEIVTETPFIEPAKTESPISRESMKPETKAPELMDSETGTTLAPESYVTEKQDHTHAPESEPQGERRTEAPSAPVEEEDVVTKAPETLDPQDKTTKIFDKPEPTSESKEEYPETTPYLVLLEEHTHKTVSPNEGITASPSDVPIKEYETSAPEVTIDKVTESVPSTETEKPPEDVIFDKDQSVPELTQTTISGKTTESSLVSEEITTISPLPESFSTEKPQNVESNEITSAPMTDQEQGETEKPSVPSVEAQTEKEVVLTSQKPSDTTVPEEEFIYATTKATTIKEEPTTLSPLHNKFGKPDDEPQPAAESEKPKPDTAEKVPKPGANEVQPTEEALQPEEESHFPPSGTSGYGQEPDYGEEDSFGPGTCRYGGKVYVSAQQIPRDDPCDFCFCFRSDIICLQQSCPPPIHGCHEEPIQGFCCPRYECPVSMATTLNVTTTTTTTTTTLPPHFLPHAYKGAAQRRGCQIKGHTYKVGEVVRASSGPCLHCTCGGDGQMKCDPKVCTPEPMLRQMIAAAVSAKRRR